MISKFAMLACGAMLFSLGQLASANAASLSSVQGEVLLDAGKGLKPVTGAANLKAGDTVIARKGSAKVTYPDGCTVNVDPGKSVAIVEKSPCAAQASAPSGSAAAAAPAAAGLSTAAMVVGGVAVAAGVGIAASEKRGSKHSASP